MAKTLLAVDDSVTMRKVLEITFSGEDFRVVTAESSQAALGKLGESPNVCLIDTSLGGEDGYALAKELRKRSPQTTIILLASRYAPYDQARGRDAGADDWADKPFDTQQLIDKVRKVMLAREAGGGTTVAAVPAPAPAPAPATSTAANPAFRLPAPSQPFAGVGRGTQQSLGGAASRATAASSGETSVQPVPPPPRPTAAAPTATAVSSPPATPHVAAAVNGQLAGKLAEMGLTQQQADAVLALSREVVERVVWEVVPQLAETMIKEEIARLTKEP